MFVILLYVCFFGALADPRVIRREASHENGKERSQAIGVKDHALVPDMLVEQQRVSSTSPTEIIVFIASPHDAHVGDTSGHLTAGTDPINSLQFTDDVDEKTQWKITDAGNGEVQIWNMAAESYLHDTGSGAIHGDYPDQRWKLEDADGGKMKIRSIGSEKYLKRPSPCGSGCYSPNIDIATDDNSDDFKFAVAVSRVIWGGVRSDPDGFTLGENTVIDVHIVRKIGGMLTEYITDPAIGTHIVDNSRHIGGDYGATTVWHMTGTGRDSVLLIGNLGDYLSDNAGTLHMGNSTSDDPRNDDALGWKLESKQEGEMLIQSELTSKNLEMNSDERPQMASTALSSTATIEEFGNKLFLILIKSISWNYP